MKLEFRKLANRQAFIESEIEFASLPRVMAAISGHRGKVQVQLAFDLNHKYQVEILGHVSADVSLECQRCLQPMTVPVKSDVALIVTTEERVREVERRFDPFVTDTDWLDLNELVQEELLLAIPFVSYHSQDMCQIDQPYKVNEDIACKVPKERDNPFQVLASLKAGNKE